MVRISYRESLRVFGNKEVVLVEYSTEPVIARGL